MGGNGGGISSVPFVVGDNINIINNDVVWSKSSNNNNGIISIAKRRAGFDESSLHPCSTSEIFTVSPGISPSALLASPIDDSPPVMLPNAQAQLSSPTTGCCSSFSPNRMMVFRCGNKANISDQDTTIAKSEECKNSWEAECLLPPLLPNCKTNNRNNNNKMTTMLHPNQQQQKCWEDGFLWRKYGQKQVKGSEFPRSYYKCTSTNCEVTKKVERSLDGQISEIVYKGSHNHPPVRKNEMPDMDITTSAAAALDLKDIPKPPPAIFDNNNNNIHEQFDHVMSPQSISNEEEEEEEEENDDHDQHPKRRKIREISLAAAGPSHETSTSSSSSRCGREPKVVLQVESEIDILEDGYRWRKYGQKVVKGNPNPRSYYKCTSPDCFVRKHVERAADDIKCVVITYEGKHNHGVPTSRSSNSNSSSAAAAAADNHISQSSVHHRVHQLDQRPLYLQERKPILNYNEFMATTSSTYNTPPPIYPYPFSLPRNPFIMNNNISMNNYHSISLPSNHMLASSSNFGPSFHYVPPMSNQDHEIKEEPKDHDTNVVYDDHTCLSLPDYGSMQVKHD